MWIHLLACAAEAPPVDEPAPEGEVMRVRVDPERVDFGDVALGTSATASLEVVNEGEESVSVTVTESLEALEVETPTLPVLPGDTGTITLTWTPASNAPLDGALDLLLIGGADGVSTIPVSGAATGPLLSVSLASSYLEEVVVGCSGETTLTIANLGNDPLTVDELSLVDGTHFSLADADGAAPDAFPWTLEPGASRDLRLAFAPTDEVVDTVTVHVVSDDPFTPELDLRVSGTGRIEGENTLTWEVGGLEGITALVQANVGTDNPDWVPHLTDALPVLFDTLLDSGSPYRIAFLVDGDGVVNGDVAYVDDSMSTEAAVEIAEGMLEQASRWDTDQQFETLANGIAENEDWLLDDEWEESKLSLVGINNDLEQSGGNATVYVSEFRTWKASEADIVVHGIGGDLPRGCGGAPAATALNDAATMTGGVFLSVCDTDWTTNMESLALAMLGDYEAFELTGEPDPETLEVYVDRVRWYDGWSYDPEQKRLSFDNDAYPDPGSTLSVTYRELAECG